MEFVALFWLHTPPLEYSRDTGPNQELFNRSLRSLREQEPLLVSNWDCMARARLSVDVASVGVSDCWRNVALCLGAVFKSLDCPARFGKFPKCCSNITAPGDIFWSGVSLFRSECCGGVILHGFDALLLPRCCANRRALGVVTIFRDSELLWSFLSLPLRDFDLSNTFVELGNASSFAPRCKLILVKLGVWYESIEAMAWITVMFLKISGKRWVHLSETKMSAVIKYIQRCIGHHCSRVVSYSYCDVIWKKFHDRSFGIQMLQKLNDLPFWLRVRWNVNHQWKKSVLAIQASCVKLIYLTRYITIYRFY